MSVRITDNTSRIKVQMGIKTNLFLRLFMEEVERVSYPRTPKREGPLSQSVLKTVITWGSIRRGVMKWVKEYAAAQEAGTIKGSPIRNYTTPGTGAHFAENSVRQVTNSATSIMKRAGVM